MRYCIWDYFPARLHTTREIIYFLENIDNIKNIVDSNPIPLSNLIFGDIFSPIIKTETMQFLAKQVNKDINKIIMEICSRKVMYYNDIPINYFYAKIHRHQYNLVEKILTDEEIDIDLKRITELCKTIFNDNIEIHVIPHLNLKTRSTKEYIRERENLVIVLENLCEKHGIKMHNIGKYIESLDSNSFLEDYMPDLLHYGKNFEKVKLFLINKITGEPNE